MEIRRFFAQKEDKNNDEIILKNDEAKHIIKVLRLKLGFFIIVSLNDGIDYLCNIVEINLDSVKVKIVKEIKNDTKMKVSITLFQSIPKKDKLDLIIQKSTELGIDKFIPVRTIYSQNEKINLERERQIVLSAAKQCGRSRLTEIESEIKLNEISNFIKDFDLVVVFYENEKNNSIYTLEKNIKNIKSLGVIIGPEGGFSEDEIKYLKSLGVISLSLGKRILRCETASIVALSILSYILGEMI